MRAPALPEAVPDWFAGFTFAAIAIGALVPAAVMSIGAANTFTRNFWKPFVDPAISPWRGSFGEACSLLVKVGALVILFIPTQFAIDLQLLGGVWMIQIFPALIFGLYTRWFRGSALLVGWAVGMMVGTYLAWTPTAWVPVHPVFGWFVAYNGLIAVTLNIAVSAMLSLVLRSEAVDETAPEDYLGGRAVHA